MNWYKVAKSDHEFNFNSAEKEIWNAILRKEQDAVDIYFDLENNDNTGDIRRFTLDYHDKSFPEDNYTLFAQMMSAGGDWENPVRYFRCQAKRGTSTEYTFVHIPPKRDGNVNLVKCERGHCATQNNDTDNEDFEDHKLWKALKKSVVKRLKEADNSSSINAEEEFNMYRWNLTKALKND
tara:strand:+ start:6475 stop:7014 length:540 start_codon:yes stop_codon:yes gene_type:complete